jgi:hypothetical protein
MQLRIRHFMAALLTGCLFSNSLLAQDAPKEEFKPSGKFSGQVFGDFQYKAHADSGNYHGGKTQYSITNTVNNAFGYPAKSNSFDIRRIYLGYDYNFTERFSAQLLLAHEGNNDVSGNRTVYLKTANLRWKNLFKGTDVVIGQQPTPAFALVTEQIYGYRFLEKTIADMRGLAPSNDVGVGLQGKYKDGMVGYNVLVGNNTGAKPEIDNFKRFYGEVWVKLLGKKLLIDLYGDYNNLGLNPVFKNQNLLKQTIAYQTTPVTIGIEVVEATQKNGAAFRPGNDPGKTDYQDVAPFGVSVYAFAPIIKEKLEIFARYDNYNPDTKYSTGITYITKGLNVKEDFFNAGLDWMPAKNIHLSPNVWLDSYRDASADTPLKKSDYDLDYRLTFFWKF